MTDHNRSSEQSELSNSASNTDTNLNTQTKPAEPLRKSLPPWKVLLHNDDENVIDDVVTTIIMLTPLSEIDAVQRTLEAHNHGVSLLLTTHRERAELYYHQFASRNLSVTIEKA